MAQKNVILLILSVCIILSVSCKVKSIRNKDEYKIISIDSIKDVYVIYAKKHNKYAKIVSKKEIDVPQTCKEVKIGKAYKLNLISLLGKEKFKTTLGGVDFHGESILLERDSINDIYMTNDLIGLCLKNDK